jgi:hypothetical protein
VLGSCSVAAAADATWLPSDESARAFAPRQCVLAVVTGPRIVVEGDDPLWRLDIVDTFHVVQRCTAAAPRIAPQKGKAEAVR